MRRIYKEDKDHNRETIGSWVQDWREKAVTDLSPLAEIAVGEGALNESVDILNKRLAKVGLNS